MSKKAKGADCKMPWLRFYGADWRGDAGLRAAGYAARGLWMDMLTLMHDAEPYGHLVVNGQPLDAARLAARLGGTAREVQALLSILEVEGVFSRTEAGVIFSRRLVRDRAKAERDQANGRGGGNPILKAAQGDNPKAEAEDNAGVNPQDKARAAHAPASQKPEARSSVSDETAAGAAHAPPTAAELIWSVGLPILGALTGKPPNSCRSLMGRLRSNLHDDCPKLLLILQEARDAGLSDPVAWLTAATMQRRLRGQECAADRRIREQDEAMFQASQEPDINPLAQFFDQPRRLN